MATFTISLASDSNFNAGGPGFDGNEVLASTLTVNADGYLISNDSVPNNGAQLTGANWTVNVNGTTGTFTPGGSGLFLYGGSGATDTVNVGTTGSIFGDSNNGVGYGIATQRNLNLNNKGTVESDYFGIWAVDNFDRDMTIVNSGRIYGRLRGIEFANNDGLHKITNTGTIQSDSIAIHASLAPNGIEQIINKGTITGQISLGGGDDTLTNSKTIFGDISMDDGADKLTNTGTITGFISLGNGLNTFTNMKTITGDVQGGFDVDSFKNLGTITGNVDTGVGDDVFTNTGTVTGVIDLSWGTDTFIGGSKSETVRDHNGADTYKLGAGNDIYIAIGSTAGNELDDMIDAGTGIDTYSAKGGLNPLVINLDSVTRSSTLGDVTATTAFGIDVSQDDIVLGGLTKDTVKGFENVIGGESSDQIYGSSAVNSLSGGKGFDAILGGGGSDQLFGGDDDDELLGDDLSATVGGADSLFGDAGADSLYGGRGKDTLTGGTEEDEFAFLAKTDSGLTAVTRDVITDFEGSGAAGGDRIVLVYMDADERVTSPANQNFTFTANDGFGAFTVGTAAQIRFQQTAAGTVIYGETTGDGKADFSILVEGVHHFSAVNGEDFIL